MKKKSQIELLMPINEDIAGQHRTNKDVNNADDPEGTLGKSFTDDDFSEDNLKKEALGLFDIPAGAPDGAQNFRGRDSYKEEDFETSNKTGFGGESVIDIDEDEHPINIQRRDEFNSANNDENRKKDFFSFLGFKSTGRSMNKELEKLASVLSKSGYSDISDKITKFSSEYEDEIVHEDYDEWDALVSVGGTYAESQQAGGDGEFTNDTFLQKAKSDPNNAYLYALREFCNGDQQASFGGEMNPSEKSKFKLYMGSKLRSAKNTVDRIEHGLEHDDIGNTSLGMTRNTSEFAELIIALQDWDKKLKKIIKDLDEKNPEKVRLRKDKEDLEKKKEKAQLDKDKKELRKAQWEAERVNANIIDEWYDSKHKVYIAKNDRGELLERNNSTMEYEFVDGYPGAGWKYSKDDDFNVWRASKRYKVLQYKDDSGDWTTYPLEKFAKEDKMKKISSRDTFSNAGEIIKVAQVVSGLSPAATKYFERNAGKVKQIDSTKVLRAQRDGGGALQALWKELYGQGVGFYDAYHAGLTEMIAGIRFDAGFFDNVGTALPENLKPKIRDKFYWWTTSATKVEKLFNNLTPAVKTILQGAGVATAGGLWDGFDLKSSNIDQAKEKMLSAAKGWDGISDALIDCYKALKDAGGQGGGQGAGGAGGGQSSNKILRYPVGGLTDVGALRSTPPPYKDAEGKTVKSSPKEVFFKKDERGNIWVCTDFNGCSSSNIRSGKFGHVLSGTKAQLAWGSNSGKPPWSLAQKVGGEWKIWNPASSSGWVRSASARKERLIKSGMIKETIRERRLDKKAFQAGSSTVKKKKKKPSGGGGGGTCGVTIQANLNKDLFHQGDATQAQKSLLDYQPIGRADGNWGPCSHSGWLLFLDALGDLGAKSPKYKSRIPAYVSGLRRRKVTSDVVQDAVDAWKALGGGRTGAAASVAPASFKDMQAQMGKEKEGKVFTDDLLIKYLLGEYDKEPLLTGPVGKLIMDYGTKILKTSRRASGMSIYAKLPPEMQKEFKALFVVRANPGGSLEGAEPTGITWDWNFLKYKARGGYILHHIIGNHKDLVIGSLKTELCGGVDKECSKMVIDDLKAQPKPESNIPLMSAISAAGVEAERAERKADASGQANLASIASAMFSMPDVVNDSLISLSKSDTTYVATNGALITHDSDMADMVSDNQKAGKIDAVMSDIIIAAGDKLKSKIFADRKLLDEIRRILKRVVKDGELDLSSGDVLKEIDYAVAQAHRGKKNWRDGYIFEQIISNKSMLKETDSWGGWDLGIGVDSRQDIIKKYREQATNPLNKRVKKRSS